MKDFEKSVNSLVKEYKSFENKKSFNEERTKQNFILDLFVNILGWDIKKDIVPEHPIRKSRVDYAIFSEDKLQFLIEAKSLTSNIDDPRFLRQAVDYGRYSFSCDWVVLTNFKKLKIINANKETKKRGYFDQKIIKTIDLTKPKLNSNDYKWLKLLSKESFKTRELDKESKNYKNPPKTIDEELLETLNEFRPKLRRNIKALKRKKGKEIDEDDLTEIVQRLINRLIFIRMLEDKKYLQPFLEPLINNESKIIIKEVTKLSKRLDEVYDSKIFEKHDVDTIEVENGILSELIDKLLYTKEGLNYDFEDIPSDVLGKIYEQYLSYSGKDKDKAKEKRKKQGIYYTPKDIVDEIVKNTIDKAIQDKSCKLSEIKILDPSCGSASFLIRAFNHLVELNKKKKKRELSYEEKIKILENNIYGVDLDNQAVELAQLNLLTKVVEKNKELPNLRKNIRIGDSLIDDPLIVGKKAFNFQEEFEDIFKTKKGFDVIIGNPPYLRADIDDKKHKEKRKWLVENNKHLYEKWDTYLAFIERSINLLKEKGQYSMIIPDAFITVKYASKMREFLSKEKFVYQINYYPNIEIFENVGVENIILFVENSLPKEKTIKKIYSSVKDVNKQVLIDLKKKGEIGFRNNETENRSYQNSELLGDIFFISVGMVLNADEKKYKNNFKKDDLISNKKNEINSERYIEAKDTEKYLIRKIRYLEWNTDRVPNQIRRKTFPELYEGEKILRGRMTEGFYEKSKILTNDSLYICKKFIDLKGVNNKSIQSSIKKNNEKTRQKLEELSKDFNYKYVLGIINSEWTFNFLKGVSRSRLSIYPDDLRKLPIIKASKQEQEKIAKLVDEIIILKKEWNQLFDKTNERKKILEQKIERLDKKINEEVNKLYNSNK